MKLEDVAIGKKIRQARKELFLTQEEVADAVEMSRSKYANIESGRTPCSVVDAADICDYLGLELNDLVDKKNKLEGLILFRQGGQLEEQELLDYSDKVFQELVGQLTLSKQISSKERGSSYV